MRLSKVLFLLLAGAEICMGQSILGTWEGGGARRGGGGSELDSFGVVLSISASGYTLTRGNKIWGSSMYIRDSSRKMGTWKNSATESMNVEPGDLVVFTPDTAHDSCYQWNEYDGWYQCLGYNTPDRFCDCMAPIWVKFDLTGSEWRAEIPNSRNSDVMDTYYLVKTREVPVASPGAAGMMRTLSAKITNTLSSVKIEYSLVKTSHVRIRAYNLEGQTVCTINDSRMSTGAYTNLWNACNNAGERVKTGSYIVMVEINGTALSQRLFVVR